MNEKVHNIAIKSEYITLSQLLKLCNIISTGGQAKKYLASHIIKVNAVNENRRGKKLYKGDVIEFDSSKVEII